MNSFSKKSEERLATCDERLQRVMREVLKDFDISVLEGHRSKAAQDEAFAKGNSKLRWPLSKHNHSPSLAVDVVPYPCDWEALNAPKAFPERYAAIMARFEELASFVRAVAHGQGVRLRHGADWNMDGNYHNDGWQDWPHWEIA